jgi:hypothetical protein
MTLAALKALRESGQFHHATYRDIGTLWEGLWIYANAKDGFLGYEPIGIFPKGDCELNAAFAYLQGTGISLGSYGRG